jgi:carbon-monoxide dehydrogenase large subunit/6-hydroxypseudooxynicotine dehydrogenase subunit gamma
MGLDEIARSMRPNERIIMGRTPGLTAERWFYTDHVTFPYGVHLAQVHVDREIGEVRVERYLMMYDVGRAVNPMLVKGQLSGGFVQGLGGALLKEFTYDEQGKPFDHLAVI